MRAGAGLALLVTGAVAAFGGAVRAETADPAIATTMEQALIERACSTPPAVATDPDKHEECLQARLSALRADFGRDLSRLSVADRRKIDSVCAPIRVEGREGYLDCLGSQLVLVQRRLSRGRDATAAPLEAVAESASAAIAPAASGAAAGTSASRKGLYLALAMVPLAGLAVPLVVKLRRSRRVCQVCGTRVGSSGDLCPACRHEAADVLRRAAAERSERQRSQEDQERRLQERAEEERRRREAEEALRQQELARAREEEAQRLEDDARRVATGTVERQPGPPADEAEVAFDPYAILGVARGGSFEAIQAAYEQAKSKYDLEQVADLGFEITQHYMAKAEAVGRAFEMLAEHHRHASTGASADPHADHADRIPAL